MLHSMAALPLSSIALILYGLAVRLLARVTVSAILARLFTMLAFTMLNRPLRFPNRLLKLMSHRD